MYPPLHRQGDRNMEDVTRIIVVFDMKIESIRLDCSAVIDENLLFLLAIINSLV